MLVKKMQLGGVTRIRIGDILFTISMIGSRSAKIGIDAPRDLVIDFEAGDDLASIHTAVAAGIQRVIEGKGDD